ncbi:hypothetical protein E8F11_08765 [Pseudomonas sp. BN417]|uniref:hypothetical protein n=1 Tax=Pseudomonas sp. BN417 TaxID=2567890 RepID=UPI00245672B5|nr:hypothetical protein [Pseudomonas sp. BN417]MDH4555271.1 hypothetical protein [Pseudomonas sp. BN417]
MPYRKRLIVAAAAVAASFMSSAHASDSVIQAYCQEKWSGNAMRAYCLEEQREAAAAIAGYSGPLRSRCESEWSTDLHMVLFCIKQQPVSQAAIGDAIQD